MKLLKNDIMKLTEKVQYIPELKQSTEMMHETVYNETQSN